MTAAERRQQEQRLVELFIRQRGANERNDRASADALFGQIWDVLAPDPKRDQLRYRRAPRQGFDGPDPLALGARDSAYPGCANWGASFWAGGRE